MARVVILLAVATSAFHPRGFVFLDRLVMSPRVPTSPARRVYLAHRGIMMMQTGAPPLPAIR